MQSAIKLITSLLIILTATQVGRRLPSSGGLIATMPLTGVNVLVWLYADHPGDSHLMQEYTRGALWGIGPRILFFLVAYPCFQAQISLPVTLLASFGVWILGAFAHQHFLG